jgi:hypothetical protein
MDFFISCFLFFSCFRAFLLLSFTMALATCFFKEDLITRDHVLFSKVCLVNIGSTCITTSQNISNSNSLAQLCPKLSRACSTISGVGILAETNMISSRISSVPSMPTSGIDNIRDSSALHSNPGISTPWSTQVVSTLWYICTTLCSNRAMIQDVVTSFIGSTT